jgi:MFS family permease
MGPRDTLLLALGAMFVQQTFATVGRNLPPVIAPAILDELRLDPAWVGIYVGICATAALVAQLSCGGFILRHGALRMSQVSLVLLGLGLAAASVGPMGFFALSAIIVGAGAALSTPSSSHLLGRYSPPRHAPLVFSLKQTAVPAGLLLGGLCGPPLNAWVGWHGALLVAGAGCIGFAILLQPLRRRFDSDRMPRHPVTLSDVRTTLVAVTRGAELRNLSLACFAFSGLQSVFIAYFITYLASMGHGLATAGAVFSAATLVAVPGRIVWGWVGSGLVAPRVLLGGLALAMAGSALLLGLSGPSWPVWLIGLAATGVSATALSWHGVLLSEAARLAPPGLRGAATGGVLSFGQVGGLVAPVAYSALLALTDSHAGGMILAGVPALVVGVMLLRGRERPAA